MGRRGAHAARLDGQEVVGFAVFRAKGSSDTRVAQGVEHALEQLRRQHADVDIQLVSSSVAYTLASYDAAIMTLVEGAALTVLVVFLFLRSWRATLVAAIALPLSILPAFAVMAWFGYTLNSITLLALTLVIGILVDDAIVEIENIERHLDMGKRPYRAALDASDAIGFAVVAITATIVAVFLPVSFIGGFVGQYFAPFGVTVSAAVLASLLVARLVTPLMAAYLLAPKPPAGQRQEAGHATGLLGRYLRMLDWALRHRRKSLALAAAFLAASLALAPLLPSGFMPVSDLSLSRVDVFFPPGTPLSQTDGKLDEMAARLRQRPEVRAVFTTAGGEDASGATDVANGQLLIRLVPADQRELSQKAFEHAVRPLLDAFPDTRYAFRGDSAARDVSIILAGADADALSRAAHALERDMRALPGLANVQVKEPLPRRTADPPARGRSGAGGRHRRVDRHGGAHRHRGRHQCQFGALQLRGPAGARARAAARARTGRPAGAGQSARLDRQRRDGGAAQRRGHRIRQRPGPHRAVRATAQDLGGRGPVRNDAGHRAGSHRRLARPARAAGRRAPDRVRRRGVHAEMFEKFSVAMTFGVLMVYAVLILLFRDFLQPLTILTSLPLAIGGAVGGLLLYGAAIDLPVVIGLLMLMGIVTKNSILMVEFVIEKRRHGMARHEALMQSGAERARPIIMTTIAMVAGMVPALLSTGADAGFRAPMAVAVIGGLITSTLLSLIFVPVVFSYMDDLRNWLAPRLARLTSVTQRDRDEEEA